jgi:hypothetical protein
MVQMLYDALPTIDFAQRTAKVEEYCGRTDEANRPAAGANMAHYFMVDAAVEYKEGRLPSQLCLCHGNWPPDPSLLIGDQLGYSDLFRT